MTTDEGQSARIDIGRAAKESESFRRALCTGRFAQVVVMTIPPGEEIGEEVHDDVDQILVFVEGWGTAVLEGERTEVSAGDLVFVPAGTRHDFVNAGRGPLRLFTIYAPPEHPAGTVHETKAEADAAEHH